MDDGFGQLPTLDARHWTVVLAPATTAQSSWVRTRLGFDPQPGDCVTVGNEEEPSVRGWITHREANKAWVELELGHVATDAASQAVGHC